MTISTCICGRIGDSEPVTIIQKFNRNIFVNFVHNGDTFAVTDSQTYINYTIAESFRNVITIRGSLTDGTQLSVSGTLTGPKQIEKLVGVNGYDIELPLTENLLIFSYTDRPGIVATYGGLLGDAGVNIASLQIARDVKRGTALSVIAVDNPVQDELVASLGEAIGAEGIHAISIDV